MSRPVGLASRRPHRAGPVGAHRLGRLLPSRWPDRWLTGTHPVPPRGRAHGPCRTPGPGGALAGLVARILKGDSHALDDGTRLSTIVLRALATLHDTASPQSAADRRALWSCAGVADDELSATVLAAGLRPSGDGVLASVTRV